MGRRSRTQGRVVGHLNNLGRSLVNQKEQKKRARKIQVIHDEQHVADAIEATTAPPMDEKKNLKSITDRSELDDFLEQAIMRDQQFVAAKQQVIVVGTSSIMELNNDREELYDYEALQIPRRPKWDGEMSPEAFDRLEKDAFLNWRRGIANISEGVSGKEITPFEKNLEVWKQLWRVVERSDIVVQIVDARDPLLYRCSDMDKYVKEVDPNKRLLLLINKADYLPYACRCTWAEYFQSKGIEFVFFSAALGQAKLDDEAKQERVSAEKRSVKEREVARAELATLREKRSDYKQHSEDALTVSKTPRSRSASDIADEPEAAAEEKQPSATERTGRTDGDTAAPTAPAVEVPTDRTRIFSRAELLEYFRSVWSRTRQELQAQHDQKFGISESSSEPSSEHGQKSALPSQASSSEGKKVKGKQRKMQRAIEQVKQKKQQQAVTADRERDQDAEKRNRIRVYVGMVGYPNVGKSSTINVLVGAKKTSVSSTPGRTKHFQTLNVGEDITVVDCPGLVFPTYGASRAHLVCSGILSIAQLHDHLSPAKVLVERVDREQYLRAYAITFHPYKAIAVEDLLNTHAKARGFVKDHGMLDVSKSARVLLKDLCRGKLLYCHPPPSLTVDGRKRFRTEYLKPLENSREGHILLDEDDVAAAEAFARASETLRSAPPVSASGDAAENDDIAEGDEDAAEASPGDTSGLPPLPPSPKPSASRPEPKASRDSKEVDEDPENDDEEEESESADTALPVETKVAKIKAHRPLPDDDQSVPLMREILPTASNKPSMFGKNGEPLSKKKLYRQRIAMKKDSTSRMRGGPGESGGALESIQAHTTGKFAVPNYRKG